MENELVRLKKEVSDRIYSRLQEKFDGNNRELARRVGCHEKTIRTIFAYKQDITLGLLFRICKALDITVSELLDGLEFNPEE